MASPSMTPLIPAMRLSEHTLEPVPRGALSSFLPAAENRNIDVAGGIKRDAPGRPGWTAQEPRRTVKPVPSNIGGIPSIKRGSVQLSPFVLREIMYTLGGGTVRSVCGALSLYWITQVRIAGVSWPSRPVVSKGWEVKSGKSGSEAFRNS